MKELSWQSKIKVLSYKELSSIDRSLVDAAREASLHSYAIYSHFNVGAALLLDNGEIVTGNNQENAAYPSGLCAERTALFWANSQYPQNAVVTLAIAARTATGELPRPIPPCGACRQVILETERRFSSPMKIILYGTDECYLMEEGIKTLLPLCFDGAFLSDHTH